MTDSVDVYGYLLPAELAALWQQAMASSHDRDPAAAAEQMQGVLRAQPDCVPAMLQTAYFLLELDRYRDAHGLAIRAGESRPASSELVLEIVKLLRRFEAIEAIETVVAAHDWSNCESAQVLVQAAAQVAPVGLYMQASALLDHAANIAPDLPDISILSGTLAKIRGDTSGARNAYTRALASQMPLPHVHWMMSLSPDDNAEASIKRIHAAQSSVTPGSEGDAHLAFAMHNVCHAAGRHDASWQALARGCAIKRGLEPYDQAAQHALFDLLQEVTPGVGAGAAATLSDSPGLIFIVGMHRSGTTLLERMLAGHGQITDGGESHVFSACLMHVADHGVRGVLDAELVRRLMHADLSEAGDAFHRYARWRAGGRAWMTEKLPTNILNLGFILRALPNARVLHMKRDPVDTCFSNLRTYFTGAAPYSYDQAELADYYLRYLDLIRHWHRVAPGRILDIDYGALVEQPETQARRIAAFCSFDYIPEMLNVERSGGTVATASVGSVRDGILKDRGEAWKPYAKHLQLLLQALRTADDT